jgi:hypothetical protein
MTERKRKPVKDDHPRPWEDRPVSVERWRRHRARLMAETPAGTRPEEWWQHERGTAPPDNEAAALHAMGELTEPELAALMPEWRAQYERAQDPAFAHCAGSRWLKGAAARRAHYRWVGIPREILERWDAERRRRTGVIRKLAKV